MHCMRNGAAGTVMYTLGDAESSHGAASKDTVSGDLLVLAWAVLSALYAVAVRRVLGEHQNETVGGLCPWTATAGCAV